MFSFFIKHQILLYSENNSSKLTTLHFDVSTKSTYDLQRYIFTFILHLLSLFLTFQPHTKTLISYLLDISLMDGSISFRINKNDYAIAHIFKYIV